MKRVLHVVGALLCIVAVAFFVNRIRQAGLVLPPGGAIALLPSLLGATAAYALAVLLLALLWSILALGRLQRDVVAGYLVAQFGKYIPGNVFQFVGRHALGRQLGLGHATLARAALYEIAFLVAAAGLLAGLLVVSVPDKLEWLRPIASVAGATLLLAILVLPRLGIRHALVLVLPWRRWATLCIGYATFFLVFGLLYWACLRAFQVAAGPGEPIGAASLGWILGFVVPGAPAGAGLREATMSLVSVGTGPQPAAVFGAIVAFRIVTMGGDLLAFLLGLWMRRRGTSNEAPDAVATVARQPHTTQHDAFAESQ